MNIEHILHIDIQNNCSSNKFITALRTYNFDGSITLIFSSDCCSSALRSDRLVAGAVSYHTHRNRSWQLHAQYFNAVLYCIVRIRTSYALFTAIASAQNNLQILQCCAQFQHPGVSVSRHIDTLAQINDVNTSS